MVVAIGYRGVGMEETGKREENKKILKIIECRVTHIPIKSSLLCE